MSIARLIQKQRNAASCAVSHSPSEAAQASAGKTGRKRNFIQHLLTALSSPCMSTPRASAALSPPRSKLLQRPHTAGGPGKLFIVAVDGSAQSIGCLRVTAALFRAAARDTLKLVTVSVGVTDKPDPNAELSLSAGHKLNPEGLLMACKLEMVRLGIPARAITTEMIDPDEMTIAEALVDATAILRRGAGLIVVGTFGKGLEKRGKAQGPMGHVAQHVLCMVKCPVVFVKGNDLVPTSDPGRERVRPALTTVVCIDGSVSRGAFDASVHFSAPGDALHLVHVVTKGVQDEEEAKVSRYWEMEAAKIRMSNESLEVVVASPQAKRGEVAKALLAYCDAVRPALVVLASVELAKPTERTEHDAPQPHAQPLGSVAQAMATKCSAHVCITKNFSAI